LVRLLDPGGVIVARNGAVAVGTTKSGEAAAELMLPPR
jgi:hypothetical protein